ncbi:DMT family transporter, partial [Huaxiibacter chinensis]|uniref:DMT family transporter n=1 Tax=Huaxiibacter chinensis TaxID=2899785 RepID=UPI003D3114A7
LAMYALFFSVAYIRLDAGAGALLLFGVVQITMVVSGLMRGERLNLTRSCGLIVAIAGIAALLLPGAVAPSLKSALLMGIAGVAWAAYSLSGKSATDPGTSTAANFLLAVPFTLLALVVSGSDLHYDHRGIVLAILSGALASAGAYVLWYAILPKIDAVTASTVQLSVPCLATLAGVIFLGEALSLSMLLSTLAVLSGIWLVVRKAP